MKTTSELTTEDHLHSLGQYNLVYNNDFRYFSNRKDKEYGVPDGWVYTDRGVNGKINYDSSSNNCVVITKSEGNESMLFKQALHEFPRWQQMLLGKTITGKIKLNTDKDGIVKVTLSDGITSFSGSILKKGDTEIDLQLTIDNAATELTITIESTAPFMVVSISSCNVNIGKISLPNLPSIINGIIGERKQYIATENPPPEELSLCNAPIALTKNQTRLNSVLNGRFGKDSNGYSMLIDMRGYFSRAWDNGATIDPNSRDRIAPGNGNITGNHVSTLQKDSFLKHQHGLAFTVSSVQSTTGGTSPNTNLVTPAPSNTNEDKDGEETRPINIYELYTIKWA
ncbi:hypothetical protein [Olleya sp. Bg11-27]|uniref:hypothetical protein n=1 Tax=Olleya sp. Bg11-27 TaxID=2058135 RepID=UPI000C30EF18|nr:hypothetical protein [Olleya sp. Bg11-27]AUC76394.1 hypothetical protein CW732_12250 [Olleya sp. Bg11-27]